LILLKAALLLENQQPKQSYVFLNHLVRADQYSLANNTFLAFLFSQHLKKPRLAEKFLRVAERVRLRQLAMLPPMGAHKESPSEFELPSLAGANLQAPALSD